MRSQFHYDASFVVVMTVLSLMMISHLLSAPNADTAPDANKSRRDIDKGIIIDYVTIKFSL